MKQLTRVPGSDIIPHYQIERVRFTGFALPVPLRKSATVAPPSPVGFKPDAFIVRACDVNGSHAAYAREFQVQVKSPEPEVDRHSHYICGLPACADYS